MRLSQEIKLQQKTKPLTSGGSSGMTQQNLQTQRHSLYLKNPKQPQLTQQNSTPINHKSSYSFGDPNLQKMQSVNDKSYQSQQIKMNTIEHITNKYSNIEQLTSKYSTTNSVRHSQELQSNKSYQKMSSFKNNYTPDQVNKKQAQTNIIKSALNNNSNIVNAHYSTNSASSSRENQQLNTLNQTPKPFTSTNVKETSKKEGSLFKDLKSQYQYQQQKKIQEIHINIEKAHDQTKIAAFKEKEKEQQKCQHQMKDFRKCCQTCKDIPNEEQPSVLDKYLSNNHTTEDAYQMQVKQDRNNNRSTCNCKQEVAQLKAQLLQESKLREFYQKQLSELQKTIAGGNNNDPYSEYMKQFKQMQQKINEKNQQLQDLNSQLTFLHNIYDNFKYISSLNYEYFAINIGDGDHKYTEIEKVELEKLYMEISKFNLIKKDQGIQVEIQNNLEDQLIFKNLKESMNLERELQSIVNENQILKQKLYSKTLDEKSINFKIQDLREQLNETSEWKKRMQSQFVERFADFVFKLNNLGVPDIKRELHSFISVLFDGAKIFDSGMNEKDLLNWIYKVYMQIVEASGISKDRWGRRQTLKGDESGALSKSVQDLGGLYGFNQSSTYSTIQQQKSFNKEQNKKEEENNESLFLQIINSQAQAIETQIYDL